MQNDRYSTHNQSSHCNWCCSQYAVGQSRARENDIFCSKRCEIEVRFWLHAILQGVQRAGKVDDAAV